MLSDCQLLRQYVENHSENAFAELVKRHINVVYRTALRRVGNNAHSADDVTQRVFTDLARKASSLLDRDSLAGWLYTSTRFSAAETVRSEQRRRIREQHAQAMHEQNTPAQEAALEPLLDDVLDQLSKQEREVILLHFFEGHTFAEVGACVALSSDAARMRVSRALDRLRTGFARRGIVSTGTALATLLAAQSTYAVPTSLVISVTHQALSASTAISAITKILHFLKLPAVWGTSATTVVAVTTVLLVRPKVVPPAEAAPTSSVLAEAKPPVVEPISKRVSAQEAIAPVIVPAESNIPRPSSGFPKEVAPSDPAFAELRQEEQAILARLWSIEQNDGPQTNHPAALQVGENAPNYAGRAPLLQRRWVRVRPPNSALVLTRQGFNYCLEHQAELTIRSNASK